MQSDPRDVCPVCGEPVTVISVIAEGWLVICESDHQTVRENL
jgi:hypothetical protein